MQERIIKVLIPTGVKTAFDYKAENDIAPGTLVRVPFGNKEITGAVWAGNADKKIPENKLKKILAVTNARLDEKLMKFLEWVAKYNMAPLGEVLAMSLLPANLLNKKKADVLEEDEIKIAHKELSEAQIAAAKELEKFSANGFSASVIDGVTGSGKTEVYFKFIEKILNCYVNPPLGFLPSRWEELKAGSDVLSSQPVPAQILILLPEIALTQQITARVKKHFGCAATLWHSNLSPKERRINYQRIREGKARIIVGARSSLFLPFKKLAAIIVDEEHDNSYKQEEGVVYHARDMAVVRAKIEEIPIILVSATPSLETIINIKEKKYNHIHLPERFGRALLPEVQVVDMRLEKNNAQEFLSQTMRQALAENLENGEQSLIYLNRRGYAPLTLCRKCGHRFQCAECSSWLVMHKRRTGKLENLNSGNSSIQAFKSSNIQKLQCHHCGFSCSVPNECPACQAKDALAACGPGVERIEEEIRNIFPAAKIIVMASDNMGNIEEMENAFSQIEKGAVDIIIGTQLVAKGHHFPKLTLVGIIDADLGLAGGDLRAAERTYQMLSQVSGRAGREELRGRVILQSYMPENAVIDALIKAERDEFLSLEANSRKENQLPPFGRLAAVIISGKNEETLKNYCRELELAAPSYKDVKILGPAPAPLFLLRGRFRFRFLVQASKNINLQNVLQEWLTQIKTPSSLRVKVDIDPYNFV